MATTQQIQDTLDISSTASIITGSAVITDVSNYGGIGVAIPDVVKIILQILDPTGNVFYQNAGYFASDYSSPDLLPLTTPSTYSFTLPTYTDGNYVQGNYTVNYKCQVTQGSDITEGFKQLYMNVCGCCGGIVANVQGDVSYNTAIVSVTDNTNYGSWAALANTLYLYPPTNTGSAQHATFAGSPATVVYEPPTGTFPYTGVWQWTLSSDITSTDPITQTSTTCRLTAQGSFNVVQSQLCKVRCLLDKYRTEFYAKIRVKPNPQAERDYLLAEADYLMAFASERCALPQTTIDKYVANIYLITGIDPDCECGCGDGTSQPLVPTSIINGADGADGSIIYSGSGAPSGGTGVVGDYYINIANGFLYKKTGASTWTYLFTMVGADGAAGASFLQGSGVPNNADGSNGDTYLDIDTGLIYLKTAGVWSQTGDLHGFDGTQVLHNDTTNSTTTTNALEILKTYALPAGQMSADGDIVNIKARFKATADNTGKLCYIYLETANVFSFFMLGLGIALDLDVSISRTGATAGKAICQAHLYSDFSGYYQTQVISQPLSNVSVSAWSSALDITIRANDQAGNAITCELFQVTFLKQA
jgi:hypothetical protein